MKKFDFKDKIKDNLFNYTYVLSDFGSIKLIGKEYNDEIQTRYYRAPEVICGCYWNKSVDIWSIGCLYFECLTGDLLFDPENNKEHDTDTVHLHWISQLIDLDMEQYKNNTHYIIEPNSSDKKISWSDLLLDYKKEINDENTIKFLKRTITNPKDRIYINDLKKIL